MGSAELMLISGILLAGYSVYSFVTILLTNNTDKEQLVWATNKEPAKSKSPLINSSRPLVHQFTLQHAIRIKNPQYRAKIERLLLTAGLNRELNVDEFIGLQIFWGLALPLVMAILNFALEAGVPWLLFPVFVFGGWQFPQFYAKRQKAERESAVRADLPFFADLLALSVQAGSDFMQAIQKIVEKSEGSVLGEEFGKVLRDVSQFGVSREEALRGLASRIDLMEITSFVAVIIDAAATGGSISQVLKDQAEQLRLERFVRAEKAGARATQLIILPIVFFIVPAVFIVVIGPVAISMITGGFK